MSSLTDLVDRIDSKLDRPADQTVLTDPRKRRSLRILDQMKEDERRREAGEPPIREGRARGGAAERSTLKRWLGGR